MFGQEKRLNQKIDTINILMDRFNHCLFQTMISEVPYYNEIVKHLQMNKGKQLRAKLSLLCANLGGELNDKSYRAAIIVEMLHTASLLHDDIVDNSMERRGAPSINSKWGNRAALLSGDIISLKALLLSLANKDYDIFKIYGNAVEQIVNGELLQLRYTRKLNTSQDMYLKIIKGKTATLFGAACKAGACTTIHDKKQIEKISLFGEYLGTAFQIRDDLFGFENNNIGKPIDNDFKQRKLTLPLIYTIDKINFRKKRKLKRILKRKSKKSDDIEWIINEVKRFGGNDYSIERMKEFGMKAINILDEFPESQSRDELEKIAKFAIERNY